MATSNFKIIANFKGLITSNSKITITTIITNSKAFITYYSKTSSFIIISIIIALAIRTFMNLKIT